MLNVSITNDYQVRPPDILAGRTVSGLLAEKTEAVRKVTESEEGQSPKSDLSAEELPRSAQDVKTQAQQRDLAIGEESGSVIGARGFHSSGGGKGVVAGIIDFRGGVSGGAVLSPSDQHFAIGEKGGAVVATRGHHSIGNIGECVVGGVVEFGRVQGVVAIGGAPGD